MVEPQFSKLTTRVRFSSPAPYAQMSSHLHKRRRGKSGRVWRAWPRTSACATREPLVSHCRQKVPLRGLSGDLREQAHTRCDLRSSGLGGVLVYKAGASRGVTSSRHDVLG